MTEFPSGPLGSIVASRTYFRRRADGSLEDWNDVCDRTIPAIAKLGKFTPEEEALVYDTQKQLKTITSGRWLWVGGTEWSLKPENFAGAYNCSSTDIVDWRSFSHVMDLAMQGCGTGAVLEERCISQLPVICNKLNVSVIGEIGSILKGDRQEKTSCDLVSQKSVLITVGDSRQGWVKAYELVLELSADECYGEEIDIEIDVSHVRPEGEPLNSFGGTANPAKLPTMFPRVAKILNGAIRRKLTSVECCLLIDEAAVVIVAGSIRRSAGMRQFSDSDKLGEVAKDDLWIQLPDGNWSIDPDRDALRMANHTRVFHHKPSWEDILGSVTKQHQSGEGAIQYAPEAIARANADLLDTDAKRREFITLYEQEPNKQAELSTFAGLYLDKLNKDKYDWGFWESDKGKEELLDRLHRLGLNPCGEICMKDNFCNLAEVHLNQIDPHDFGEQERAFKAGALSVAALLNHDLSTIGDRYQKSRELDPIVAVCPTGIFDFFVKAFGVEWLKWWEAGRPKMWGDDYVYVPLGEIFSQVSADVMPISEFFTLREQEYLTYWRQIVERTVKEYCDRHNLKAPNRATALQPSGTKSLLTGASPGFHPPKAAYMIRRITVRKNHPVAFAAIALGHSVLPSQSDKDENGVLLNDPFDPRCTEWLIEIPMKTIWADQEGCADIDVSKFSAVAQFDFYMQVQKNYTRHNCFDRNTTFLTAQGIKSFQDFEAGDTTTVLNKDGQWVEATVVKTEEEREMIEIVLRQGKSGKEKRIVSTLCHRFPVKRISGGNCATKIVPATELKIGHRLVLNSTDFEFLGLDLDGVRHGLVYGDGSIYKNSAGKDTGCQLYLCGGKRHLVSYFDGFERVRERDDIDQTRIYGLPVRWKYLPKNNCSQRYLAGFFAGLLATDGSVHQSTISISTISQALIDFLSEQLPRIGVRLCSYKWFTSSSYKEDGGAFVVIFSKGTISEDLILRPHHLDHFNSSESQPCQWKVSEINKLEGKRHGWCVMEPQTNHFTLTDNILVMNTSATLEMREDEIEPLAKCIYEAIQNDDGYISAALLARFDDVQTYPRLPFEPIDRASYEALEQAIAERRAQKEIALAFRLKEAGITTYDFDSLYKFYDQGDVLSPETDACDTGLCEMKETLEQIKSDSFTAEIL